MINDLAVLMVNILYTQPFDLTVVVVLFLNF